MCLRASALIRMSSIVQHLGELWGKRKQETYRILHSLDTITLMSSNWYNQIQSDYCPTHARTQGFLHVLSMFLCVSDHVCDHTCSE